MNKTSIGLAENVTGLLCYILGWVTGLVFILIEQENKFVRFHAIQSIIVFGALTIIAFVLSLLPIFGGFLSGIVSVIGLVLWIVFMIKAYQGIIYKLPWAGDLAEKWVGQQS